MKHGRQACSNTTSASHIWLRRYPLATSARSCRIRSLHQGEGLRTSGTKSLRREEDLLMSGKTAPHRRAQRTLSVHLAASATTASQTASRVRVVKCPYLCDLRHQHRTAQIRGPSREGRRSTVDYPLRRGGCTATCNSQLFFVRVENLRTPSLKHVWIVLGISGAFCACTACTHPNLGLCGGTRRRREYGLEQFIEASSSQYHTNTFLNVSPIETRPGAHRLTSAAATATKSARL